MPTDTIIALAGILGAFAFFSVVLIIADISSPQK